MARTEAPGARRLVPPSTWTSRPSCATSYPERAVKGQCWSTWIMRLPLKPRQVIDALVHYYEHENSNIHRGAHTLAARHRQVRGVRARLAEFIGARLLGGDRLHPQHDGGDQPRRQHLGRSTSAGMTRSSSARWSTTQPGAMADAGGG